MDRGPFIEAVYIEQTGTWPMAFIAFWALVRDRYGQLLRWTFTSTA